MAKILIVDDDPLLIGMYQTKFQNDGYTVITASNGEDALSKIESFVPNLILLDVMMPRMDGFEVLRKLKEKEETKKIPVVMLTNVSVSDTDNKHALELGAVSYLVKSNYTPKEIVAKVKEIIVEYNTHVN